MSSRVDAKDLVATLEALRLGGVSAEGLFEQALEAANQTPSAYMRLFSSGAEASRRADLRRRSGDAVHPLDGISVSVKDLFDVKGYPTSASSRVLQNAPAAHQDSACVRRLRDAGAILMGHTVMTEFAYSGLGLNPWFGTPTNLATKVLDGKMRIPGGSSSGAAVSVVSGSALAALGTDTGGSLRIPAALCGLVGFKPTQELTARQGMLPLSASLDTPGAITRSVRDAILMHEVLTGRGVHPVNRGRSTFRLLVPGAPFTDGMDDEVASSYERALRLLSDSGMQLIEKRLQGLETFDMPRQLASIVAGEAYRLHADTLAREASSYDPRVAARILKGMDVGDDALRQLLDLRRHWLLDVWRSLKGFDAVIVPTVPIIAPELQPLVLDDEMYSSANLLMLRNPAVVNHLDGCAISIPCQEQGQLPAGLMLFASGGSDETLLGLASHIESVLQ